MKLTYGEGGKREEESATEGETTTLEFSFNYKGVVIFALILALSYSTIDAIDRYLSSGKAATAEMILEKDGVRVYRFYDNGRWHYYAHARGQVSTDDVQTSQ